MVIPPMEVLISIWRSGYTYGRDQGSEAWIDRENYMQWTAPAFEEVCLNCEINSYASAKL
jgi:coenzyme PQQ precursor peptide PqqA